MNFQDFQEENKFVYKNDHFCENCAFSDGLNYSPDFDDFMDGDLLTLCSNMLRDTPVKVYCKGICNKWKRK